MNVSVVGTVILTAICWTGGSFTASEHCNISLSIIQSHSRISLPLYGLSTSKLSPTNRWHSGIGGLRAQLPSALAVQAAPALVPLSSEICASSDRKHSETIFFIQKVSHSCLSSWRRWWATPLCQRRQKHYAELVTHRGMVGYNVC